MPEKFKLEQPVVIALVLALAVIAVYWPVGSFAFTNYDDPEYFSENSHVLAGLSWANLKWALQTTDNASWYPVTWLSFLLDATLFGKGPGGPHSVNLLLHTANVVLLFLLLRRLTGAQWKSALVAGLFALHPLRVEAIAWIAERKGLLSALFGLLVLHAYASYVEWSGGRSPKGQANEAMNHYLEALRIRPELAEAHYNLANALASRGQIETAGQHYEASLRSDPNSADAHNNPAYMLMRQGKLDGAESEFRSALALQPDLWQARYGLTAVLTRQGKTQEAIQVRTNGSAGKP
jgi:hypothetical protein